MDFDLTSAFDVQHFRINKPITKTACPVPPLFHGSGSNEAKRKAERLEFNTDFSLLPLASTFPDAVTRNRS